MQIMPSSLWERLPFIGRLFVTASIALLLAGTAMLFLTARQEAEEVRTDLEMELAQELETLPATLAETVAVGDFATLQQILDRYCHRSLIGSIAFIDTTGIHLACTDTPPPIHAPAWFIHFFGFSGVEGASAVLVGGRRYGTLHLSITANELANRAWNRFIRHMGILMLAILIDFIGIWLVLRNGLAPPGTAGVRCSEDR